MALHIQRHGVYLSEMIVSSKGDLPFVTAEHYIALLGLRFIRHEMFCNQSVHAYISSSPVFVNTEICP